MLKIAFAGLVLELAHGWRFDIKDPDGLPACEQFYSGFVLERLDTVEIDLPAIVFMDSRAGITDYGQGAVAENIHLDQPHLLGLVLLPLNDHDLTHICGDSSALHGNCTGEVQNLFGGLQGDIALQPIRGDHHAAAVKREMAGKSADSFRQGDDLRPGLVQFRPLEDRMGAEHLRHARRLPVAGQLFGDRTDLAVGNSVHLGDLAHRRADLETVMVGDHGDAAPAVGAKEIVEHIVPLIPGKIDIDIGGIAAAGIEEPFEKEIVADRVDVGDAEAVADQAGGSRAAPAGARRLPDRIGNDEEIRRKSFVIDQIQLKLHALPHRRGDLAIAPARSGQDLLSQPALGVFPMRACERGKYETAEIEIEGAVAGDCKGIGQSVGGIRKERFHLPGRMETGMPRGDLARRDLFQCGIEIDGAQEAMDGIVLLAEEIGTAAGGDRDLPAAGEAEQLFTPRVRDEFGIKIIPGPSRGELAEEGNIPGQDDDLRINGLEEPGQDGLFPGMQGGDEPAEGVVALHTAGEDDRFFPLRLQMRAGEGLQMMLAGLIEKKSEAIEPVGVGEGKMGERVRFCRGADLLNRIGTAAERIVGMHVKGNIAHRAGISGGQAISFSITA